ncbi:MAG: type II toxin-antitoxin system HicB family antitoxin [Limisphaerales bacterium]
MSLKFTAVFRRFPEGYAAFVEELPGANTQGATLEEARANLLEAARMVLEANRAARKVSAVPRHREILEFTAWKICKDLDVPRP